MATRATISIQNTDGSVTGIWCKYDGYVSHTGQVLFDNYTTEEKVRELIALGDLEFVGEEIGIKVDFDKCDGTEGQCIAYGRDRGDTNCSAKTYDSFQLLKNSIPVQYSYLFDITDNNWYVSTGKSKIKNLLSKSSKIKQKKIVVS